jgi:hypothetical protein
MPIHRDHVYVLDLSPEVDASADRGSDGAAPTQLAAPDGGGTAPDGGRESTLIQLNCGPLAEGCTPGQPCSAACACVLAREQMGWPSNTVVDQCILVAGAQPGVEIRTHLQVDCE